jgi:hypothetical protein
VEGAAEGPAAEEHGALSLHAVGQLGHVAYRHRKLECSFDGLADQQRFTDIWRPHIGKTPAFEPAETDA